MDFSRHCSAEDRGWTSQQPQLGRLPARPFRIFWRVTFIAILAFSLLPRSSAATQDTAWTQFQPGISFQQCSTGGAGGSGGSASRTPFKVRMAGFLHTKTSSKSTLGPVTFGIAALRQSYDFELDVLEAVDRPRISTRKILRALRRYENNIDVVGPSPLLSQIARAEQGTYLTLTGFLTLRTRRFQIVTVQTQPAEVSRSTW